MTGNLIINDRLRLYPPWVSHRTELFGRWTVLCGILIITSYIAYYYISRKKSIVEVVTEEVNTPLFSIEEWLRTLQDIDTSIRTPRAKAEALFDHYQRYYIEKYTIQHWKSLTVTELHSYATDASITSYEALATIIYNESHPTHAQIHNIVQDSIRIIKSHSE